MSIRELSGLFDAFSRYFAVQEPEDGGEASRVRLMRRKRPAPRETGQRKRRAPSPELRGPSAGLHAAPLARVARHQGRQTRGSQLVLGSAGDMPSGSSGSDQTAAPARKVIRPPRAARQPKRIETRLMSPDFGVLSRPLVLLNIISCFFVIQDLLPLLSLRLPGPAQTRSFGPRRFARVHQRHWT